MQLKSLFIIGVIVSALLSLFFIIKQDLNLAVMSMMAMFALTNGSRSKSYREQGMVRESKWMLWLSLFFGAAFIIFLVLNFI